MTVKGIKKGPRNDKEELVNTLKSSKLKRGYIENYNSPIMNSFTDFLYQVSRPARYTGGEWNSIVKDWKTATIHVALAYPDSYEIGMSNLALPILYEILNKEPDILAERVYAPWSDMERVMRQHHLPLFSLESKRPLKDFDIIGFSLGYELTYTNVLNMLDLAQIPPLSSDRDSSHPFIIAGGSCTLNPEPMADFIDLFFIGDGEEVILEFMDVYRAYRGNKEEILRQAATIPGVYVPRFYEVNYQKNGTIASIKPKVSQASPTIKRRIVTRLPPPVTKPVVPYIEIIHDRGAIEIQRGCSRGCRFCQAGIIYRPVRERSHEEVIRATEQIIKNCGYNEISLVSLSTGDYHGIETLLAKLSRRYSQNNLSLSLPSLCLDPSSVRLIESLPWQRKTTLTFAPESGSERLRTAINKRVSEETILDTLAAAFERDWLNIKLYFMIGLPTETIDDVKSIIDLITKIGSLSKKGRQPRVRISLSTFIPKPHTPCQWSAQDKEENLLSKYQLLRQGLKRAGVQLSWQDPKTSQLEAILSRGDRRLGKTIYKAWQLGCKFDAWREHFNYQGWLQAFTETGLDPAFYANRKCPEDELLPWSHIDTGVTPTFLRKEYQKLSQEKETPDCRYDLCSSCGLHRWYPDCQQKLKQSEKAPESKHKNLEES